MSQPFAFEVNEVEKRTPQRAVKIDETYRPMFDALAQLDDDHEIKATFDDEKIADAAKKSIQALAREAGYTARERRGSRVKHEDGTVSTAFYKAPKPKRGEEPQVVGQADASQDGAPAK